VSMSSWADEADENQAPDFADLPPKKSGWGNVEKVQPAGLVFEDFEVRALFRRGARPAAPSLRMAVRRPVALGADECKTFSLCAYTGPCRRKPRSWRWRSRM
jgi:hypothetical protein